MSALKLAIAMGYIDDRLVSGAVEYKPHSNEKVVHFGKLIAMAAACIMLIFGIGFLIPLNETPPENNLPSASPAHFYYDGNVYIFRGKCVYSLPEGYAFVGEVNNVGCSSTAGFDFEGNVDGYIFMSESEKSVAYFQWKEWNETLSGKEPYLAMILEK